MAGESNFDEYKDQQFGQLQSFAPKASDLATIQKHKSHRPDQLIDSPKASFSGHSGTNTNAKRGEYNNTATNLIGGHRDDSYLNKQR